jgi:hypothetical protein
MAEFVLAQIVSREGVHPNRVLDKNVAVQSLQLQQASSNLNKCAASRRETWDAYLFGTAGVVLIGMPFAFPPESVFAFAGILIWGGIRYQRLEEAVEGFWELAPVTPLCVVGRMEFGVSHG